MGLQKGKAGPGSIPHLNLLGTTIVSPSESFYGGNWRLGWVTGGWGQLAVGMGIYTLVLEWFIACFCIGLLYVSML